MGAQIHGKDRDAEIYKKVLPPSHWCAATNSHAPRKCAGPNMEKNPAFYSNKLSVSGYSPGNITAKGLTSKNIL